MASSELLQLLGATEGSFLNLSAVAGRVPAATGITFAGICCASPEIDSDFSVIENKSTRNKFYKRAPGLGLRRGSVKADLYLRGCGDGVGFTDPTFKVYDACFGKQSTSNADYVVTEWLTGGQVFTVESTVGLAVGQGFAVTVDGISHVSFIQNITGLVIGCYPPIPEAVVTADPVPPIRGGRTYAIGRDFAAGTSMAFKALYESLSETAFGCQGRTMGINLVTGEPAVANVELVAGYVVPNGAAETLGATSEPAGAWVKFLNAICTIGGVQTDVRSVNWKIDFAPQAKVSPHNAAGLSAWEMGAASVTAEVALSAYDTDRFDQLVSATQVDSLLCTMGTGTAGSAVAIYCPQMNQAAVPKKAMADGLVGQTLSLQADNTEADAGSYVGSDATDVADTIFRIFFERG